MGIAPLSPTPRFTLEMVLLAYNVWMRADFILAEYL